MMFDAYDAFQLGNIPLFQFPYDPRWKVSLSPPTIGIHEGNLYCIVASAEWLGHIVGVIDRLAEPDAWASDADYALGEILKLQARIHGCMILRQNPTNPCILQQSHDFGQTWSTAFDYSLCMVNDPASKYTLYLQAKSQSAGWSGAYGGDIGTVFPNVVYDSTADDQYRDLALCYALKGYVIAICEAAAETIEDDKAIVDNVTWALGIAAGATGLWAGFGLTLWIPLGLSLGAMGAQIASAVLGNMASQYRDESAQEEVHCYMFNQLKGSTVQAGDFAGALSGSSFSGNADKIGDAVAVTLNNIDAYLAFMNMVSEAYTMAQNGLITEEDCPCDLTWCKVLDFTTDAYSEFVTMHNFTTYVPGMGYVAGDGHVSGVKRRLAQIFVALPAGTYDPHAIVTYTYEYGYQNGGYSLSLINDTRSTRIPYPDTRPPATYTLDFNQTIDHNFDFEVYVQPYYRVTTTPSYSGVGIIRSIKFSGTGENPFGEDNC